MNVLKSQFGRAAALACVPFAVWAQGGFNGPGRYEITNVRSGKVIDLDRNNQTTVIQFSSRDTDNQQWNITPAGPGYWYFRNAMNGAALEAMDMRNSTPVRGMPFTGSPAQQWRIMPSRDGNALITSRLGKTLDIPNGQVRDGVRVQTYDINGNPNQQFTFRRLVGFNPGGPRREEDDWDHDRRWERYYGHMDERDHQWGMAGDGVCFYRQEGFRGRAFCVRAGDELRHLPQSFSERFRSARVFGHVRVVAVFSEEDFGGQRTRFDHDQPDLRGLGRIASLRVF